MLERINIFGSDDQEFLGLASKNIEFEEATKNIKMLKEALGVKAVAGMEGRGGGAGESLKSKTIETLHVNTLVAQTLITRALEKSAVAVAGPVPGTVINAPSANQYTNNVMSTPQLALSNENAAIAIMAKYAR